MTKITTPKPSLSSLISNPADGDPAPLAPPVTLRPKLVVPLGRGGRGKTWWTRWAVERAQDAGRAVVVADADRTNATLSAYFAGVITPPSAEDAEMGDWFTAFIEQLVERKLTATLDLGGGDLLIKRINHEASVVEFLEGNGVQVVAVHVLGPDRDDLAYLRDLEANRLFAPDATMLVLNEALVPAERSVQAAFEGVMNNSIFEAAAERGAVPVWMPRLKPAHEVDERRLTFAAAEASRVKEAQTPIGLWNRQVIAKWRRTMEINFASVTDWLP